MIRHNTLGMPTRSHWPQERNTATVKYIKILLSCLLMYLSPSVYGDVRISNLDDFNFGLYSGFGRLRNNDNICINTIPQTNYQITFWGNGVGGAFEVNNGIDRLDYRVLFNDRARRQGGQNVSPGLPFTRQRRASDSIGCPGGLNANIDILFRRSDLQAANPGRYIGLLIVTIAPE